MQCSWSFCYAEFRSALLPSICQLAADDNAFPWFVPSLTLSSPLRLSAFISLAQRPPSSPPLSISFPFSSISLRCSNPLPPSPFRPSALISPPLSPALLASLFHARALRFPFMIVHRAQLRNGFIIELPSAMNLSLFWRNTRYAFPGRGKRGRGEGKKSIHRNEYILRILMFEIGNCEEWGNFRWGRIIVIIYYYFFFYLIRNTMSKLREKIYYYCFIYSRAFFIFIFFF